MIIVIEGVGGNFVFRLTYFKLILVSEDLILHTYITFVADNVRGEKFSDVKKFQIER